MAPAGVACVPIPVAAPMVDAPNPMESEGVRPPEPVACASMDIGAVEIECVMGGALMRVSFGPFTNPALVPALLRKLDPAVKFKEDFPRGGFGGGGKRDTKCARVLVINVDVRESGKFVTMTAAGVDGDLTVMVGKKVVDEWPTKLEGLGRLGPEKIAKVRGAFENRKSATVILHEAEQFGATYWTTDDGRAFLEEMQFNPPAPLAEGGAA